MSSSGQARSFSGDNPNPYKQGMVSPIRMVPGAEKETCIKTDLMHTFNLGIGGDLSSSSIMLLCKLKMFDGRAIDTQLDHAFDSFSQWCRDNHKTPSTKSFEKKRFHMKKNLGLNLAYKFCVWLFHWGHLQTQDIFGSQPHQICQL